MQCTSVLRVIESNPSIIATHESFSAWLSESLEHSATHTELPIIEVGLFSSKWSGATLATLVTALAKLPLELLGTTRKIIPESALIAPQCWTFKMRTQSVSLVTETLSQLELDQADAVLMPETTTPIRFACFDMDSTLIKVEVIDELAKHANVGEKVSQITARAMRGELDFRASFTARMALLNGLSADVIDQIRATIPLMDGAEQLIKGLVSRHIQTAIFSGGFDIFAHHVAAQLGMNAVHANTLEVVDGALTGTVFEPVVDAEQKLALLKHYISELNIEPSATLAAGDGANDLLMLSHAGIGVAFHAKPLVKQQAKYAFSTQDLSALLYLLD